MATSPLTPQPSTDQPVQFNYNIKTNLTQDNYLLWKSQILTVLRGHGLTKYLDPSLSSPPSTISSSSGTIDNPDFVKWHQQDQLIMAWMFNSISPSILAQVVTCESTSQLWEKLKEYHTSQSLARVMEIKLKLQTAKRGNASCAEYLQYMHSLMDRLRSVGSEIPEQDLIFHILRGLGTDYDNFVTSITTRQGTITLGELQNLLFSQEAWLQATVPSSQLGSAHLSANTTSLSHTSGLTTQQFNQFNSNIAPGSDSTGSVHALATRFSSPRPFYSQNQRGRGRGRQRGRGRGRTSPAQFSMAGCQICFRTNHTAANCFYRYNSNYTGEMTSQVTQSVASQPQPQSYQALLATPAQAPQPSWFLDSGATTHVTNDLNSLSSSVAYSGSELVHMGNGEGLSISHIGTSVLSTHNANFILNNVLYVPGITKNLISISQLTRDNKITVEFNATD